MTKLFYKLHKKFFEEREFQFDGKELTSKIIDYKEDVKLPFDIIFRWLLRCLLEIILVVGTLVFHIIVHADFWEWCLAIVCMLILLFCCWLFKIDVAERFEIFYINKTEYGKKIMENNNIAWDENEKLYKERKRIEKEEKERQEKEKEVEHIKEIIDLYVQKYGVEDVKNLLKK